MNLARRTTLQAIVSRSPRTVSLRSRPAALALGLAAITVSAIGAEEHNTILPLPFTETFSSLSLSPLWTTHADTGNAVEARSGVLRLQAHANTRAHVERPLGVDSIRVSTGVHADDAVTPALLCLSWDESNFIQFGLNHPTGGRLNVRETLGTYPRDYDLGPATVGEWRTLAIELTKNCIRYLASADGNTFECVHFSRRPGRFAGAPKLLVLGQDSEGKLFARPDPWIVAPSSAKVGESEFRNLRVTPLSTEATRATAAERRMLGKRERDLVGEQELSSRGDPSFESVSRHFPALKWSREIVGVKDHPFDMGVAPDGSLQLSDVIANHTKPVAFFKVNGHRLGSGPSGCAKRLLNGWMPIVVSAEKHDGLEFEQTVLGHSEGFSPDTPLSGYVQFRAVNSGATTRSLQLELAFEAATNAPSSLRWTLDLPANGSRAVAVRIPFKIRENPAAEVPIAEFEGRLRETSAYWEKLIAQGSRFEIPEARVQNAYRAWLAYNFLNVAKRKDVFHICDGSGFYNEVYGYSAALYCNALDLLGCHDLAATYCDSLLTFMQTNGLLAVNFGDTDTGAALWTMSEHYRLTRNTNWLRQVSPKMQAMCGWIVEQRQKALAKTDEPVLTRGLIRYRPYADLLHPAADYFSNGYLWKGLDATARVFAEIGMTDEARRFQAEADRYLRDIRSSMKAAVFKDRGQKILPAIPDTHELWKESNGSADGYYGIIAPCMLEAGVPASGDPMARLVVNALERRGGLMAGVSQFHQMADHAYTYGYWMNCLERDDVERAILGLYGSLAFGMSRDTYAAVECTAIRTGENYWMLPHTYSNTQQLRLLRNLLVREDGDTLWLGQAIPRNWLAPGQHVAVNEAPTSFGPVSYRIETKADGTMRVELTPPTRTPPKQLFLRLRHPQQGKIAGITLEGTARCRVRGDTIRLTDCSGPLCLNVMFKPGGGMVGR